MTKSLKGKKFFLDSHGCAKNQVDSELIISKLEQMGMLLCDTAEAADLIFINSCGFIESAKKESLDSLMDARNAFPDKKIILGGCLAERYSKVFEKELPEADGIFGNGDLDKVNEVVEDVFADKRSVVVPLQEGVCCGTRNHSLSFPGSSFVKVTEGCNNCCTFCAIPLIRGKLRSRKISEITDEIKLLVSSGVKEINLIGQDLAAYGCGEKDDVTGKGINYYNELYVDAKQIVLEDKFFDGVKIHSPLYELCKAISLIEGDFWIRLLYIHPDHFNSDVLQIMKNDKRFLPYFDIPFQSGDDSVIKAMNRKGSFVSYKKVVETIRSSFPESCIRTTLLAGFPGESDENAKNTLEFVKQIKPDWAGCFYYSREEDTPAALMKNQVKSKVKLERKQKLEETQIPITEESLRKRVGKVYKVLVEEIIKNESGSDEGLALGRAWFEAPEVDGSFVIRYDLDDERAVKMVTPGSFVNVKALASSGVDLDGELIVSE